MPRVPEATFLRDDLWEPQGSRYAPKIPLPDGRIFATVRKVFGVNSVDVIGRCGVTAVMDVDAPENARSLWLHSKDLAVTGKANADELTVEDMRSAATQFPLCPVEGNEFAEGSYSIYPHDDPKHNAFAEVRKQLYTNAGKPYRNYGVYGSFACYQMNYPWRTDDGVTRNPTDNAFRSLYASQAAARASCSYFTTQANILGANVKDYSDVPDYRRNVYSKNHAIRIMGKGLGKRGGIGPGFLVYFDWNNIEGLSGAHDLHNGIIVERRLPNGDGVIATSPHPKVDFNLQTLRVFLNGFVWSDGYVTFDTGDLYGTDPNTCTTLNQPNPDRANLVEFRPDRAGAVAPVRSAGGYFEEPCRGHDAGFKAAWYYAQTKPTEGQPWQDLAWRYVGSDVWNQPRADESTILDIAAMNNGQGGPLVQGRILNNKLTFFGAAPNQNPWETTSVIARIANRDYRLDMRGYEINLWNETI